MVREWFGRTLCRSPLGSLAGSRLKIIELLLWSSNLLGHILLFVLTLPILIPCSDCFHATLLCERSLFPWHTTRLAVFAPARRLSLRLSSSFSMIRASRASSSLLEARPNAVSLSLLSFWQRSPASAGRCNAYVHDADRLLQRKGSNTDLILLDNGRWCLLVF